MAIGILARMVDVERVVGMLDERYAQPALHESRDQLLDGRRFAAAGPSGKTEDLHTRTIFAPASASTAASTRRTTGLAKRRLPYSAPSQPPMITAGARTHTYAGSAALFATAASPATELTRMKGAATAEVCLVPAQPSMRSK